MGRPLAEHYRRIAVGTLAKYTGKDHRVTRDLIGWLAAGPESTRTGVMRIHTGAIADDLGWTRAQVETAIARLSADGLAVWSPEVRVITCRFVLDVLGISAPNHKTSAINQIAGLPDCEATRHALEVVQAREIKGEEGALNAPRNARRNAPLQGASHGAEKREERREKREEKSSPCGELPVATAPVTGWTFQPHKPKAQDHTIDSQKSEVEQRLSYNEESNPEPEATTGEGDSPAFHGGYEDDGVPDWAAAAMAKAAAPSALPSFPGVRNPEVAARLAAADAERQASLTLTAPKAKPTKTLSPKQLDAIFAREQMAKWVAEWNGDSGMAKVNAPAVMGDVAKLATVLMGHAARLTSTSGALVGPHELLGWAAQHGGYHGGSGAKKWTLKGWLAADHVGEVFAAYRDWCVKQDRTKRWGYHIERTLTDWREEHAEAAEQAQRVKELDDAA